MGNKITEFENKFEKISLEKNAFAVNSATSALELTAQLCNFKKNDEVIIPTHTYTSSCCYPFIKNGAKIVWADIDLDTRVVSDEFIMSKLTKNTKAVVVPHLYGYFKDVRDAIGEILNTKNVLLIEDAAQAIGTSIGDDKVGTLGDFSIFSFSFT